MNTRIVFQIRIDRLRKAGYEVTIGEVDQNGNRTISVQPGALCFTKAATILTPESATLNVTMDELRDRVVPMAALRRGLMAREIGHFWDAEYIRAQLAKDEQSR